MKLIALILACSSMAPLNLEAFFGADYARAVNRLRADSKTVAHAAGLYAQDELLLRSIVFPEYIRNNVFSGMMETRSLELTYVEMGLDAVDFSIGPLQMKPSFAQQVEKLAGEDKTLRTKYKALLIPGGASRPARAQRVQRLNKLEWQLVYLACFADYCTCLYGLQDLNKADRLKYLATAYNMGVGTAKQNVENYFDVRAFPYGRKYNIEQVCYWEVSLDYYLKHQTRGYAGTK